MIVARLEATNAAKVVSTGAVGATILVWVITMATAGANLLCNEDKRCHKEGFHAFFVTRG